MFDLLLVQKVLDEFVHVGAELFVFNHLESWSIRDLDVPLVVPASVDELTADEDRKKQERTHAQHMHIIFH